MSGPRPASEPSLVQDTVYRRARRDLVSNLHALDDRLSRRHSTRARILFEAASPNGGAAIYSVAFNPPELPGDYNANGIVDAADYVMWRKLIGAGGISTRRSASRKT